MRFAVLTLLAVLVAPSALAQAQERIDVRIDVTRGAATVTGEGAARLNLTPGEDYRFTLNLTKDYTTFEVRASGLDLERASQLVPHLYIAMGEAECDRVKGTCDFSLFEQFPNDDVWDVDAPARVYSVNGTPDAVVLRLGVPGPVNATLLLARDVAPPNWTLRPMQDLTTIGFYQESVTDELSRADLQVRARGATEWIQNPTPTFHYLQRFPVQGLTANRTFEWRVLFEDWAGNEAATPTFLVTTPPEPVRPIPLVTIVSPLANATVPAEGVIVKVAWDSPESSVPTDGVRLFFDKKEITEGIGRGEDEAAYVPPTALAPGLHSVSVEVRNDAGGVGVAKWTFTVERAESPLPGLAASLLIAGAAAFVLNTRRARKR